jgi:hypothetical protein
MRSGTWSARRNGWPSGGWESRPEKLLTIDHHLRRFQYRITAPLFVEHLSTIDVHDLDDGTCLVVYSVDAEPAVLALVIGGAARAALGHLPEVLGVAAHR